MDREGGAAVHSFLWSRQAVIVYWIHISAAQYVTVVLKVIKGQWEVACAQHAAMALRVMENCLWGVGVDPQLRLLQYCFLVWLVQIKMESSHHT